jgi:hypothetical protein
MLHLPRGLVLLLTPCCTELFAPCIISLFPEMLGLDGSGWNTRSGGLLRFSLKAATGFPRGPSISYEADGMSRHGADPFGATECFARPFAASQFLFPQPSFILRPMTHFIPGYTSYKPRQSRRLVLIFDCHAFLLAQAPGVNKWRCPVVKIPIQADLRCSFTATASSFL